MGLLYERGGVRGGINDGCESVEELIKSVWEQGVSKNLRGACYNAALFVTCSYA